MMQASNKKRIPLASGEKWSHRDAVTVLSLRNTPHNGVYANIATSENIRGNVIKVNTHNPCDRGVDEFRSNNNC